MMLSIETLHQEGLLPELAYQFAMMLKRLTGDSPENALREIGIVKVQEDTITRWYEQYYS